jgi:hypothetical protein
VDTFVSEKWIPSGSRNGDDPEIETRGDPSRFRGWDCPDKWDTDLRHLIEFYKTQIRRTGKEVAWAEVGRVPESPGGRFQPQSWYLRTVVTLLL